MTIEGDEKEIREYPVEELKFRPRKKKADKGDKGNSCLLYTSRCV